MEQRPGTLVPSPDVLEKLSEYAGLLARFGPRSSEAVAFYHAHEHLPVFAYHAHDLERLEEEDHGPERDLKVKRT